MDNEQTHVIFRVEGQIGYHWGADQEIMAIINRRDKSPEIGHETDRISKTGSNETTLEQKSGQRNLCAKTTGRK